MPRLSNLCVLFSLIGFLSGSVMYSYEIPKLVKGIDVRKAAPDRNPGGANAIHVAGAGIGLVCVALDVLKAFVPVYAAVVFAGIRGAELVPVTAAPVFGHAFTPFLKFRGGKAIASFFGSMLGLFPLSRIVLLPAAVMFLFKLLLDIRPDSLCVFAGLFVSCVALLFLEPDPSVRTSFFLTQAVVLYKIARNPNWGETSIRIGHRTLRAADSRPKLRRP
jgi:glycerol-3-phosphate acyltransferase PlsY